jgi:hypothetical protein
MVSLAINPACPPSSWWGPQQKSPPCRFQPGPHLPINPPPNSFMLGPRLVFHRWHLLMVCRVACGHNDMIDMFWVLYWYSTYCM